MGRYACRAGCFVCGVADHQPHGSGCCASTSCDSRRYDDQIIKWLKAENKHREQEGKRVARWLKAEAKHKQLLARWLIAEKLWLLHCEQWLDAESQWLQEQQNRRREMAEARKPVKIRKPAEVNSPSIQAARQKHAMKTR